MQTFQIGQQVIVNDKNSAYAGARVTVTKLHYDGRLATVEMPSGTGHGTISFSLRLQDALA